MEKKLREFFDFQRFEQNGRLAEIIAKAESARAEPLSDDDLEYVCAAGEIDVLTDKDENNRHDDD